MRYIRFRFLGKGTGPGEWIYRDVPGYAKTAKEFLDETLELEAEDSNLSGFKIIEGNVVYRLPKHVKLSRIADYEMGITMCKQGIVEYERMIKEMEDILK